MDRFFTPQLVVPAPPQLGDSIELPEDEAAHISRVLRKRAGDQVELFDGQGNVVTAALVDVRKKGVTAEIAGEVRSTPPRAKRLVIATAVPKADRFKWLVEKVTELGVDELIPLECERSVVHPGGSKLDKMRATVIAACKQSGRNHLMTIAEPVTFAEILKQPTEQRLMTDVPVVGDDSPIAAADDVLVLVGPEGGWTDEERSSAREAGFAPLTIGPHVLRVETAVIAAASRLV